MTGKWGVQKRSVRGVLTYVQHARKREETRNPPHKCRSKCARAAPAAELSGQAATSRVPICENLRLSAVMKS